jgi:hypothetical protein
MPRRSVIHRQHNRSLGILSRHFSKYHDAELPHGHECVIDTSMSYKGYPPTSFPNILAKRHLLVRTSLQYTTCIHESIDFPLSISPPTFGLVTHVFGITALVGATMAPSTSPANLRTMRTVESPLMILAIVTVALRLYSRLAVKRKLAVDDVLIVLALVRPRLLLLFDTILIQR